MAQDSNGLEVTTAIGTLRARGTDVIAGLGLLGIVAMGAVLYMHMEDVKENVHRFSAVNKEMAQALKESNEGFTKALTEVVRTQRLSACILATDQKTREAEYMQPNSFCNRVSQ